MKKLHYFLELVKDIASHPNPKYWITELHGYFLRKKRNVIGHKLIGDVLEVYVEKKYSSSKAEELITKQNVDFWRKDLVPKHKRVFGKKRLCRVIETDLPRANKIEGGMALFPSDVPVKDKWYGTGGLVVKRIVVDTSKMSYELSGVPNWMFDKLQGAFKDQYYLLTNRHVVMKDYFDDTTIVNCMQTSKFGQDVVGPVVEVGSEDYDYALIKLEGTHDPYVKGVGIVKGFKKPENNVSLRMNGATTGYSKGSVLRTDITIQMNMGGKGLKTFRHITKLEKMNTGGDSGAVAVDKDGYARVHINGSSSMYTFGQDITIMKKKTGVTV